MTLDMTKGNILSVLLRFTIPILIGDLFQQFYNIADTVIVGRTLGTNALAAVGSTGTIMFFLLGATAALANGFAVVTSQNFGSKDADGVRKSFVTGLSLLFVIALLCTALSLLGGRALLTLMNTPEDIYEDAYDYISVIFMGLTTTCFYNYFAASLRAIGNSRTPLYFLVLSSCLNIVLDLVFILVFGLGVTGASLATVVAQLISAICCFVYILRCASDLVPEKGGWMPDRKIATLQLVIGVPMALQTAITASGTMIMQSAANTFGSTAVAANTAASKCRCVFSQPMLSMGSSVATFAGQNYGNKDIARVREGALTVMKIMTVYSLIVAVAANLLLPWEIRLFVSSADSVAAMMPWARRYMLLCSVFFIPLSYIFIFRSALQGCGRSIVAMCAGFVELGSRIILAAATLYFHSYTLCCLCDSAAWLTAGIYTTVMFWVLTRKMLSPAPNSIS